MDVRLSSSMSKFDNIYIEIDSADTFRDVRFKITHTCMVDNIDYYDFTIICGNDGDHTMTCDTKLCDHLNGDSHIMVALNEEQSSILKLNSFGISMDAETLRTYICKFRSANDQNLKDEILVVVNLLFNIESIVKDESMATAISTYSEPGMNNGGHEILELLCNKKCISKHVNKIASGSRNHILVDMLINGNVECVNILCELNNVEVDRVESVSVCGNAIHGTITVNNLTALKLLAENNMDNICGMTESEDNILIKASKLGHLDMVKWLLQLNAFNIFYENKLGSAYSCANDGNHKLVMNELIRHNKTDVKLQKNGQSRIKWNIMKYISDGDLYNVKNVINAWKFDINIDYHGWKFINKASYYGHLNIVKWLHEQNADLETECVDGYRSIQIAAQCGHLDIIKYLHEHGADLKNVTDKKCTPLMIASLNGYFDIVKYLCDHGADVNAMNINKLTPMMAASFKGHIQIVKYLCNCPGIDLNIISDSKITSIRMSSMFGHLDILKYLHESGANIHKNGLAYSAAENGHLNTLKYICGNMNVDMNYVNMLGYTMLLKASMGGHLDVVKYLCHNGVDVDIKYKDTKCASQLAMSNGNKDVALYLYSLIPRIKCVDD